MKNDPPRNENLPPGYDEDDPYDDIELDTLPDWWRQNVHLHDQFDLRPYRPPRFIDDKIVPEQIRKLENEFGVEIQLKTNEPKSNQWKIYIDGNDVGTFSHSRDGEGYSVYGILSTTFTSLVKEVVSSKHNT